VPDAANYIMCRWERRPICLSASLFVISCFIAGAPMKKQPTLLLLFRL